MNISFFSSSCPPNCDLQYCIYITTYIPSFMINHNKFWHDKKPRWCQSTNIREMVVKLKFKFYMPIPFRLISKFPSNRKTENQSEEATHQQWFRKAATLVSGSLKLDIKVCVKFSTWLTNWFLNLSASSFLYAWKLYNIWASIPV